MTYTQSTAKKQHALSTPDLPNSTSEDLPRYRKCQLRFGENFPLKLTFDFADGAGHVEYFLAPRVEGDY